METTQKTLIEKLHDPEVAQFIHNFALAGHDIRKLLLQCVSIDAEQEFRLPNLLSDHKPPKITAYLEQYKDYIKEKTGTRPFSANDVKVLLDLRNNKELREKVQRDDFYIGWATHLDIDEYVITKWFATWDHIQDVDLLQEPRQIDEKSQEDIDVLLHKQPDDYGSPTGAVPYLTKKWAEKLYKAGKPILHIDVINKANEVFAGERGVFPQLLNLPSVWKRSKIGNPGFYCRSDIGSDTRYINEHGEAQILGCWGNRYADYKDAALPVILCTKG